LQLILRRHERQVFCHFVGVKLGNVNDDVEGGDNAERRFTDSGRQEHVGVSDDAFDRHGSPL
jgi:hypothetical protein